MKLIATVVSFIFSRSYHCYDNRATSVAFKTLSKRVFLYVEVEESH